MRALPADSLEYFGDTAVGKTALTAARAAGAGGVAAGGAGAGAAVGAGPGAAAAVAPHCVLRNSFQVCPARVPPDLAAWYLALHSLAVSAPADDAKTRDNPVASAAMESAVVERMCMEGPPADGRSGITRPNMPMVIRAGNRFDARRFYAFLAPRETGKNYSVRSSCCGGLTF